MSELFYLTDSFLLCSALLAVDLDHCAIFRAEKANDFFQRQKIVGVFIEASFLAIPRVDVQNLVENMKGSKVDLKATFDHLKKTQDLCNNRKS